MQIKKMIFVGDTVLNIPFSFGMRLETLFLQHDLRILNLEGAFSKAKIPLVKSGPSILLNETCFSPIIKCFNVAALANNHTMDYKDEGLKTTLSICKEKEILTVGAGNDLNDAHMPLDFDNVRILSVAEREFGGATDKKAGVALAEEHSQIYKHITEGKQTGKIVIIIAHGGTEIIPIPPPYIRQRYKLWVDFGADLVIGGHPHVVQGKEIYKGKTIFYSLGNFCFLNWDDFLQYPDALWSIAVSVDIVQNIISVIPIRPNKIMGEGVIIDVSSSLLDMERFNCLSDMIQSIDYSKMYKEIATKLYTDWYARLKVKDADDAAYVLNLLRCDAHRNIIQEELSNIMGEYK